MDYIRHTKAIDSFYGSLNRLIKNGIFSGRNVVMFGSSKISGMVIYYLSLHGIIVKAIVDNDKMRQGKRAFGIDIYSPEDYITENHKGSIFLLASAYQDEMRAQLLQLGVMEQNIVKVIDLPELMNDYDFVDRKGFKTMSVEDIKKSQFGVLKHLKEICEKYHLRYYLCGGTLLGAVRHKGYIPWDDDIDVFVELEDLEKLVDIMKSDRDYSLISFLDKDSDYYDEISLMVDNNTIYDTNHFPIQLTTGVSIDIFYISGMPKEQNELEKYVDEVKRLDQLRWNKLYSEDECRKATDELISYLKRYRFDECENVGCILAPHFMREILPKSTFAHKTELKFETEYFSVPEKYEFYLNRMYGNYMKLPPKEKQVSHHYFNAYYKENNV